ncbi:MAG TPA: HAD family hydrolase, partial [Gammaproteobacteria bacterium]|nr:HAD family hydrolase [Gammaproteobacteria bacterium]
MPQTTPICWNEIDTVLVDMDGTLLDLAFDNYFWLELVPREYARARGLDAAEAERQVLARYASVAGSLAWYCVEHWTRELDLDIAELKWRHRHRIAYLPGARHFLAAMRSLGKHVRLVTNAHPRALAIKLEQTQLEREVDSLVSSHDVGAPKEKPEFWTRFAAQR